MSMSCEDCGRTVPAARPCPYCARNDAEMGTNSAPLSELADLQTMYEKSVGQLEHRGLTPTMVVQYDDPVDGLLDAYFASNTPDHYAGEPPMSLIDAQVAAYTTNTATLDAYHELQLRLPGDPMWGSGPKD